MGWRGIGPVQTSRRVQAQGGFTEGGWSSKNSTCCSSDSTWMLGPVPPSMTRHPELKMLGIGSNWENNFFSAEPLQTVGVQLLQGRTSQEKTDTILISVKRSSWVGLSLVVWWFGALDIFCMVQEVNDGQKGFLCQVFEHWSFLCQLSNKIEVGPTNPVW